MERSIVEVELWIEEGNFCGLILQRGKPIKKVQIDIWDEEKQLSITTLTDHKGEFQIEGIEDGYYKVEIYSESLELSKQIDIYVQYGEIAQMLQINELTTDEEGEISGFVDNLQGEPLSGCLVNLYRLLQGQQLDTPIDYTYTSEDGQYIFKRLAIGNYQVITKLE